MTNREWLHKMIDLIEDEGDLAMLKWLMQPYAAKSLNKKYREERNHEEEPKDTVPA